MRKSTTGFFVICFFCLELISSEMASQECDSLVDFFSKKIINNYAGFSSGREKKQFSRFVSKLKSTPGNCVDKLAEIQYFLSDPHVQFYSYSDSLIYSNNELRIHDLNKEDSLVGYWINEWENKMIFIDKTNGDNYRGYIYAARDSSLKKGQLYYSLKKEGSIFKTRIYIPGLTVFTTTKYNRKHEMVVGMLNKWRKINQGDTSLLFSKISRSWEPHVRDIGDRIILVKVPSSSFKDKEILDSLLSLNANNISSAKGMVIDITDNSGGSVLVLYQLLKYLNSGSIPGFASLVLSSEENIKTEEENLAYLESVNVSAEVIESVRRRIIKMKENKDFFYHDIADTMKFDSVFRYPQKVAIIVNYATASAAELFVLKAIQSKKVLVVGEQTAGALKCVDMNVFQSASMKYEFTIPGVRLDLSKFGKFLNRYSIVPQKQLASRDWISEAKQLLLRELSDLR